MSIKNLLKEEIESEFSELGKIEVGSDKYKSAVDGLTKLVDRAIELDKIESERKDKIESREIETDIKLKQMEDENKDRFVKNCLTGASLVSGIGLTVWGALKSWQFEKEGTVTSTMGRMFMNCFRPKK